MREERFPDGDGRLVLPDGDVRAGFLVLSGSSGRVELERAQVLASYGIAALAMKWFGGPGQPGTPREVPLELLGPALDRLDGLSDCLGVMGSSFGAEASLLLALGDQRIDLVAALAPPSVMFGTVDQDPDGRPIPASKWTKGGEPLPYVPYVDRTGWTGPEFRTAREIHQVSFDLFAAGVPEAIIPVEEIEADVLVSAGGDDEVWQAEAFADQIQRRREAAGKRTLVVKDAAAGHRIIFPGENPPPRRADLSRGGTVEADRRHGQAVLDALLELLP
jgi:hypothetical protein